MLDGGPAVMLHRPSCVPEGAWGWNRLGWFSHPTGNLGSLPAGFLPTLQSFSIRSAMQGPAAWQLAHYGHSWHKGTQWNMPRGQRLRLLGLLQPGQPNTPSLPREACARPMLGLYNQHMNFTTQLTNLHSALPGEYQDLPSSSEDAEAQRTLATWLGWSSKEASELKASTDLPHTSFWEKPSDISEAFFQILLSLKTRHATTSRVKIPNSSRASWQTRGFPWAKKGFPASHSHLPQTIPTPPSRNLKTLGVPLYWARTNGEVSEKRGFMPQNKLKFRSPMLALQPHIPQPSVPGSQDAAVLRSADSEVPGAKRCFHISGQPPPLREEGKGKEIELIRVIYTTC